MTQRDFRRLCPQNLHTLQMNTVAVSVSSELNEAMQNMTRVQARRPLLDPAAASHEDKRAWTEHDYLSAAWMWSNKRSVSHDGGGAANTELATRSTGPRRKDRQTGETVNLSEVKYGPRKQGRTSSKNTPPPTPKQAAGLANHARVKQCLSILRFGNRLGGGEGGIRRFWWTRPVLMLLESGCKAAAKLLEILIWFYFFKN